jgi:type II secretory pathway pseudopilin PulG
MTNYKKQTGFSIIELVIVLAVAAMMMQITIKANINADIVEQTETDVKRTINEIKNIQSAAGGYLVDLDEWPDFANNCANAINTLKNAPTAYLNYITTTSPYNTPYMTECNINTFSVKLKSDKDFAAPYIAAQHPGSAVLPSPNNDMSISSVPRPEEQPALTQFLMLDGSRAMESDLNMGDNAIKKVSNIDLNGQDIKLGLGKFISMGSYEFKTLSAIITKPICTQGNRSGISKVILSIHGITTKKGGDLGIRNVEWSAKFDSINSTQWRLSTTGLTSITGIAEIFCDYGTWNR